MADTSIITLQRTSAKRTRALFADDFASPATLETVPPLPYTSIPQAEPPQVLADRAGLSARIRSEYARTRALPPALEAKQQAAAGAATAAARRAKKAKAAAAGDGERPSDPRAARLIGDIAEREDAAAPAAAGNAQALILRAKTAGGGSVGQVESMSLVRRDTVRQARPQWHAPWKLMRVISGHLGWVRSLAVEPGNQWFASGAGDRTIKIWDLASGSLKLTLTGHISTVRGLAVSPRHPLLFSCGEDKMVKCWDLEANKVIRHYHGHLSGVYTLSLHPTLDVLVTGGRDGVARVWDMRTRSNIHVLSGHKGTVADVKCQEVDPQVISASLDSTIRLWDLAAGKTMGVLTHHKKGVRTLATHPNEFTFASGSANSIKQWKLPEAAFLTNFEGHNSIVNTLAVNADNVLFSGADDGTVSFWDWKTGHRFQDTASVAQPGSLDAEAGIFASTFDLSGSRLITGEADKTIKIWKEDTEATPESNPLDWQPTLGRRKF
jgi:pleiotropic regulator 1